MRTKSTIIAVTAAALTAGMISTPSSAQEQHTPLTEAGKAEHRITLITGDQVAVDAGGKAVSIVPAPGREKIPVTADIQQGHTYIVPLDA